MTNPLHKLRTLFELASEQARAHPSQALTELYNWREDGILAEALNYIISNPSEIERISAIAYDHNNGFTKLTIFKNQQDSFAPRLRIHIWDDPLKGEESVFDIHNHPWDYASIVLCGTLCHTIYTETTFNPVKFSYFKGSCPTLASKNKNVIVSGKKVCLKILKTAVFPKNTVYYLNASAIHGLSPWAPKGITATLVIQLSHYKKQSSMYFPSNETHKNVFPAQTINSQRVCDLLAKTIASMKEN
jgi:hypothetical protein